MHICYVKATDTRRFNDIQKRKSINIPFQYLLTNFFQGMLSTTPVIERQLLLARQVSLNLYIHNRWIDANQSLPAWASNTAVAVAKTAEDN